MSLEAQNIKKIYTGLLPNNYDPRISHIFGQYKQAAFQESSLKPGDHVLVFCCGTGLDFPYILDRIGHDGKIVGVDFSSAMLEKARGKVAEHGWKNVQLVEADVTKYHDENENTYDCGVCSLGISIIPEYENAYENLLAHVKPQGEVIIGDVQLASGWLALFNPVTIVTARKFGGTREGHRNSTELCARMCSELVDVRRKELLFKSYFYCIGKKE